MSIFSGLRSLWIISSLVRYINASIIYFIILETFSSSNFCYYFSSSLHGPRSGEDGDLWYKGRCVLICNFAVGNAFAPAMLQRLHSNTVCWKGRIEQSTIPNSEIVASFDTINDTGSVGSRPSEASRYETRGYFDTRRPKSHDEWWRRFAKDQALEPEKPTFFQRLRERWRQLIAEWSMLYLTNPM